MVDFCKNVSLAWMTSLGMYYRLWWC